MKGIASIAILLCLVLLASGQAAAQQFGTKVQSGDPDVGLPLSGFSPFVGIPPQNPAFLAYWNIGSTPGLYDDQDVAYLEFGGSPVVKANDIRLTGWGAYPAGSYVKPGDSDIGQTTTPPPPLPSWPSIRFYYMNVAGGGYDLGDPIYLKAISAAFPVMTNANDIRITANAGFPAGSRVSLNDPDAAKPLTSFMPVPAIPAAGGPLFTAPAAPIAQLAFYNANGNVLGVFPGSQPIYDEGDVVYFDVTPVNIVSPNDVRLY